MLMTDVDGVKSNARMLSSPMRKRRAVIDDT